MLLTKYGAAFTFHAPVIKAGAVDFAASGDWTPAAGDVKVTKDEGAEANIGTLPTYTNGQWKWTLSATELQAARVAIKVVDSAAKAVEDQSFVVLTYGHASAHITGDLDAVTEARLAELDAANLPSDVDSIKAAATEARLAELDAANLPSDVDTIKAAATEARLAELDEANIPTDLANILVTGGAGPWTTGSGGDATAANQTTILNKLLRYFQLALRSDAAIGTDLATELNAINADEGSGAGDYSQATDSQEAIRDRGDANWSATGTVTVNVSANAVSQQTLSDAGEITIVQHSTFRATITGLGSLVGRGDVKFTIKLTTDKADADAIIQISENDGLIALNGVTTGLTSSLASLTVDDQDAGDVTIVIDETVTDDLAVANKLVYSVKVIDQAGDDQELTSVDYARDATTYARVIPGVTRATS